MWLSLRSTPVASQLNQIGGVVIPRPRSFNMTEFKTQDMTEAAFIWCQPNADFRGLQLKPGTGPKDTYLFQFVLPLTEAELMSLILQYKNGRTLVEPFMFMKHINSLRDFIKQKRKR